MGLTIKVYCTDCGHEREVEGIETCDLILGVLMIETRNCECTKQCEKCEDIKKCEDCEDTEIYKKTIVELRTEAARLKLQLRGVQLANEL